MEPKDIFATVCYFVLMDHHGAGFAEAHPSYIAEKHCMIQEGWSAFGRLDIQNIRRVMDWCRAWKFEPPEVVVKRFDLEIAAEASLRSRGINI